MKGMLLLLIKATVFLLLACAVLGGLSRRLSEIRFLVAASSLLAIVLLPLASAAAPDWSILPTWSKSIDRPPAWRPVDRPTRPTSEPRPPTAERAASPPTRSAVSGAEPHSGTGLGTAPSPAVWIGFLWLVAALWISARFALGWAQLERLRQLADPLGGSWGEMVERRRRELGLRRAVEVRRLDRLAMPQTCGLVRPAILLPSDCDHWPPARRDAVLAHELVHVARWDVLWQAVGRLALALYWFHPLVWLLERRMAVERELACDAAVLRLRRDRRGYARELLTIVSHYGVSRDGVSPGGALAVASPSEMERRIMTILQSSNPQNASPRLRLLVAVGFFGALAPLATLAWTVPTSHSEETTAPQVRNLDPQSDVEDFQRALRAAGVDPGDPEELLVLVVSESTVLRAASAWALGHRALGGREGQSGSTEARSAVAALIDLLDDPDARTRQWAARSLGQVRDPRARESLVAHAGDPDAEVRQWMVRSLTQVGPVVVDDVLPHLDDPDAEVRQWALRSLLRSSDPEAAGAAVDLLDDADAEVREWAARLLGARGVASSVDALLVRLDERDAETLEWVVRALGSIGDERAIGPLTTLAEDPAAAPNVREWAVRSLAEIAAPERLSGPRWDRQGPEPLLPDLLASPAEPGNPEVIASAIRSLASRDAEARQWSARSLARLGDRSAVAPLLATLEDPDAEVREWSIRALAALRAADAVGPLIGSLDDRDAQVREWAVRTLGVLEKQTAVDPLVARLQDDSAQVREWATRALGALGDASVAAAISARLDDDDADVRYWAQRALDALE